MTHFVLTVLGLFLGDLPSQDTKIYKKSFMDDHTRSLIHACREGRFDDVLRLLECSGVNVHAHEEEAFWWACQTGHLEVVELLLSLTHDNYIDVHARNNEAFVWACMYGHLEIVQLLLAAPGGGARNINVHFHFEDAFIYACMNGHLRVVELLLAAPQGDTRYINIHAQNEEAFCWAFICGHLEVMGHLLSQTNDRRIRFKEVHAANNYIYRHYKHVSWRAAALSVFKNSQYFKCFSTMYCVA